MQQINDLIKPYSLMRKHSSFIVLFLGLIQFTACQWTNTEADLPNIILILTDDLGYADLSSYGATDLQTPHIDLLVRGGLQCSNYHTNSPVCSPTRAALLTGRYPDLVGMPGVVRTDTADSWGYLAPDAQLLPRILKQKYNYNTAHIGKWNLGLSSPNLPNERGFEHFKGFLGDKMDDYYTHLRHNINYLRYNEHKISPQATHATDLFSAWASEYILSRSQQKQPFFMYLAYNAPHNPIQVPDDWIARYKQRYPQTPEPRAKYCAMVEHLDNGIGQLMSSLQQAGLNDNTLLIFSSDNGGNLGAGANNGNVRGSKATMYEGALRVPLAIWYPPKIAANSHSNALLLSMDIAPTILDIIQQWFMPQHEPDKQQTNTLLAQFNFDGSSFLPLLNGDTTFALQRDLFWIWRESGDAFGTANQIEAYRTQNDFKLLRPAPNANFELYNLTADPQEQHNLSISDTTTFNRIAQKLKARVAKSYQVPCKAPNP